MAIQQQVQCSFVLVGDGVSTVFTYAWAQLFQFEVAPNNEGVPGSANNINPNTVPSSIQAINPDGVLPSYTPTLDSFGNLVLTFSEPWGAGVIGYATLLLNFNSGQLAGSEVTWNSATPVNTSFQQAISDTSLSVAISVTGTVTAGTILFEASADGQNWFQIQGMIPGGLNPRVEASSRRR